MAPAEKSLIFWLELLKSEHTVKRWNVFLSHRYSPGAPFHSLGKPLGVAGAEVPAHGPLNDSKPRRFRKPAVAMDWRWSMCAASISPHD